MTQKEFRVRLVNSMVESIGPDVEDPFGLLWLGGDNGPFTFDPVQRIFHRWKTVEGDSINVANSRAYAILRDSTGTMWVASDGAGLLAV